jgi:hypothetical protein
MEADSAMMIVVTGPRLFRGTDFPRRDVRLWPDRSGIPFRNRMRNADTRKVYPRVPVTNPDRVQAIRYTIAQEGWQLNFSPKITGHKRLASGIKAAGEG